METQPEHHESGSEEGIFTRYVHAFEPGGDSPASSNFDAVWEALRKTLYWELYRRGLWHRTPRYLGVYGSPQWSAAGKDGDDALGELTADAFSYVFIQRIASLQAQLALKPNIEGLIRLNVTHFVQELQERHDPLGARIFALLRRAVRDCVESGLLLVVRGDPRIGNDSVLAFPDTDPETPITRDDELSDAVTPWCDDLLPDLVTTRGKGQRKLDARLRTKVCELERFGIGLFTFKDLLQGLRREARRRWMAAFDRRTGSDWGVERQDDELFELVPLVSPDTGFEARQSLRWLLDCVGRRLAENASDSRTSTELEALWDTLVGWAAEAEPTERESPPSRRELARLLGIPRERLPGLYDKLKKLAQACEDSQYAHAGGVGGPGSPPRATGAVAMQEQDPRTRLRNAAVEAAAQAAHARAELATRAPRPGDVYVLRPSAGRPVEWVLVDGDRERPGWWIAVPADTRKRAGSADLALEAGAPGGPLTLRCGLALSIPSVLLEPELRSRCLGSRDAERARDQQRRLAEGTFDAPAGRETVDLDPAYQDVLEEAAAARADVAAGLDRPAAPLAFPTARARPARFRWIEPLAAVLALATIGLAIWTVVLQDQLRRFEAPDFEPPVSEIRLNEDRRTPDPWQLSSGDGSIVLYLVLRKPYVCSELRFELTAADSRTLWSRELEMERGEVKLVLPRRFLERQPRRLRVLDLCGAEPRLLEELPLTLVWE